ncbi:MAG: SH3 domain-containing protein [Eubacteriales bacterium]
MHGTGAEGYISPKYVKIVSKVDKGSGTTATAGEITANSVNLRSGPGTKYAKLDKLQKLDRLTILDKSGDWYKVTATAINKTGYVYASFVKVTSTSPTPTPGPATPTPVPTTAPAGSQQGKVNATAVNFRSGRGRNIPAPPSSPKTRR